MRPIRQLIVHQTDTDEGTLESIRAYHMNVKGWRDIGYHFLLTRDALVHKGRPQGEVGAHCLEENTDSLGVCLVGRGPAFPLGKGYMTHSMFRSLMELIQELRAAYPGIDANIYGHREKPSGKRQGKTCPGFDCDILRRLLATG